MGFPPTTGYLDALACGKRYRSQQHDHGIPKELGKDLAMMIDEQTRKIVQVCLDAAQKALDADDKYLVLSMLAQAREMLRDKF